MHENVNVKKCIKISKIRLKGNFYSFVFKSQSYAQVVEIFVQTCVCVSATFRNSACVVFKTLKNIYCSLNPHRCASHVSIFMRHIHGFASLSLDLERHTRHWHFRLQIGGASIYLLLCFLHNSKLSSWASVFYTLCLVWIPLTYLVW